MSWLYCKYLVTTGFVITFVKNDMYIVLRTDSYRSVLGSKDAFVLSQQYI